MFKSQASTLSVSTWNNEISRSNQDNNSQAVNNNDFHEKTYSTIPVSEVTFFLIYLFLVEG